MGLLHHPYILMLLVISLLHSEFQVNGFTLTRAMVPSFKKELKKVHVEEVIPSVIEPSFGIGRVFYALLEHSFRSGPDHAPLWFIYAH